MQHVMRIFSQGLSETALTTQNLGCFNEAFQLPVQVHKESGTPRDLTSPCQIP